MKPCISRINTDIGYIYAISDGASLTHIHFQNTFENSKFNDGNVKFSEDSNTEQFFHELKQYLSGSLKKFSVKINPNGTDFQKKCWLALANISYGNTISYGEFAKKYLTEKQLRAFSGNIGRNPLPIILPCHRVVGKNGDLTGFAGGISIKKTLLSIEKAI